MKSQKLCLISKIYFDNILCKFEIYDCNDFSELELKKAREVRGLVLDENNKILIVGNGKTWNLPGGAVEKNETLEQALIREVYEESAVIINEKTIKPFFYQIGFVKNSNNTWINEGYQTRFICKIKTKDKFIKDPDLDVKYQKYVLINELDKYIKWDSIKFIQNKLNYFLTQN
jgi:hypothetical protein